MMAESPSDYTLLEPTGANHLSLDWKACISNNTTREERWHTLPSPAYKCRRLLAEVPPVLRHDSLVHSFPWTCNLSQGHNLPPALIFTEASPRSFVAYQVNMATRWGLCGAGKISHDFSVAMKTLSPADHQVLRCKPAHYTRLSHKMSPFGVSRAADRATLWWMPVCFSPLLQIAVIASRSLARAKEFAKKHGIPKAYGSYEELASDPDIGEFRVKIQLVCKGRDNGLLLSELLFASS